MVGGVWTWVLSGCLLVTLTQATSPPAPDMTYWLSFPRYARPGQVMSVNVWISGATGPVTLNLELMDYRGKNLQDGQNFTLQATEDVQTVQFQISETFTSSYYYSAYLRARGFGGKVFQGFKRVYIRNYDRLTVFIQTDKSVYTPGQKVKFRALAMTSELGISKQPVDVTIFDPNYNRVAAWFNLTSDDESGVVQGEMMTSNDPPLGGWRIQATVDGVSTSKKFRVLVYDEPRFDVRVRFDKKYALTSEDKVTAKVIARYLHGTPVLGSGFINVTLSYYRQTDSSIVREFQLNDKGQADVVFTRDELTDMAFNATYTWLAQRYPNTYTEAYLASRRRTFNLNYKTFNFRAVVTERITEDVSTREKRLRFYERPFNLRYIAPTPPSYKSDLPVNVYVELMQPDYSERVENPEQYTVLFTIYYYRPWSTAIDGEYSTRYSWQRPPSQKQVIRSKIVQVNSEGLAVWEIDCHSFPQDATYIIVEAKSGDVRTNKYMYRFDSPSKTFLHLRMKTARVRVGKTVDIVAESNKEFGSFAYQVLTKGRVVLFKKMVQTTKSKKAEFSVEITQEMYPAANVVVFFEAENGEVVAERLVVPVDGQLANEVSLKFKKSEVKPGKKAKLLVKGKVGSRVFLLGVDKAVKMLGKGNDITREDLLEELATMGGSGLYWRNGEIYYYYYARDTDDVFNSAMVGLITDGVVPGVYYLSDIPTPFRHLFTTTRSTSTTTTTTRRPTPTTTTTTTTRPSTTTTRRPTTTRRTTTRAPTTTPTTPAAPPPTTDVPEPEPPTPFEPVEVLSQLLPETWLFDSVVLKENTTTLRLEVPDTPSTYIVSAFALHPEDGLSVPMEPVELLAIKRLFFSLEVPPRVIRGEDVCFTAVTLYTEQGTVEASLYLDQNATAFDNVLVRRKGGKTKVVRKPSSEVVSLGTLQANDRKTSVFCVNPKVLEDVFVQVALKKGKKAEDRQVGEMKVLPGGVHRQQVYPQLVEVDSDNSYTSTANLDVPTGFVEGSLNVVFQVSGNLLGISAENLRNLLRLPSATGDLNIANFAPAVYVYKFLQKTDGLNNRMNRRTRMFMLTALQTQLKSRRWDGSFSAFGLRDKAGSVRVTALLVKSLAQAAELGNDVVTVDANLVNRAVYWLERQLNTDGSFKEPGRDAHPKLRSGSMELTAFVTIALQEVKLSFYDRLSSFYQSRLTNALRRAKAHLEANLVGCANDPYAASIVAYALGLTGSTKANDARQAMERLATTQGNMKYWNVPRVVRQTNYEWYRLTNPLSIEATSYALLTLLLTGTVDDVMPIFRWLNTQRGPYGGFITLHDTVVAYEALSKFATLNLAGNFSPVEFEVMWSVGTGPTRTQVVTVSRSNVNDLQEVVVPSENGKYPHSVTIKAKTKSKKRVFVYAQLFVDYNLVRSTAKQAFTAEVTVTKNTVKSFVVTTCVRRTTSVTSSSGVVAKIAFPSGYDVDREGSDFGAAGHVEFLERKAILYYASLGSEDECSVLRMRMTKGSVANNKPVPVRVFDLYSPDDEYTTMYSIKQFGVCEVEPNYMEC